MKFWVVVILFCSTIGLIGCGLLESSTGAEGTPTAEVAFATPTPNPMFANPQGDERIQVTRTPPPDPTLSQLFVNIEATDVAATEAAPPLPTPTNTPPPTPIPTLGVRTMELLYEDDLHSDWEIVTRGEYNVVHTANPYGGSASVIFTPTLGARTILFTVKESAERTYRHEDILGITMQIFSINNYIGLDDVAMTVFGSNEVPYWELSDFSVENIGIPNENWVGREDRYSNWYATIYPETTIRWLEVSRAIVPQEWVPVSNWLPAREMAPPYEYVTGFYIKTHQAFGGSLQIDDIRLIALNE